MCPLVTNKKTRVYFNGQRAKLNDEENKKSDKIEWGGIEHVLYQTRPSHSEKALRVEEILHEFD